MSGKYTQTLSFCIAALLSLTFGKSEVSADSFIEPARNAYLLKKTADRPYLQSVPVPQVWQTDSVSEEFKRSLLDALSPETKEERHFNALSRQLDEEDRQRDYQTVFLDEKIRDFHDSAEIVNYFVPVAINAMSTVLDGVAETDAAAAEYERKIALRDLKKWDDDLFDIRSYLNSIRDISLWGAETDDVENLFEKKRKQENGILIDAEKEKKEFGGILEKAENIYSYELDLLRDYRIVNEAMATFTVDDLLDLSTGIGIMEDKGVYPPDEVVENLPKSASFLDRKQKTDQIPKGTLFGEKKALLEKLQKSIKRKNKKDAK